MKDPRPRSATVYLQVLTILATVLGVAFVSHSFIPDVYAASNGSLVVQRRTSPQGFLSVRGQSIVKANGEAIVLRGVSYAGYHYDISYVELVRHSESNYQKFAQSGFNVVRLAIAWSNLEPTPDSFDSAFLKNYVDRDIQWAKKYGLYVILDMHQWNWAYRFGGAGAPDWAVRQYEATKAGKYAAIVDFWTQDKTLQAHLITVWTKIAAIYKNESAVAGYDLFNEPYCDFGSSVSEFHIQAATAIRAVDPNHILFIEPADVGVGEGTDSNIPIENIVWSPHFYTLSFASTYDHSQMPVLQAEMATIYDKFVVRFGTPVWVGEYGAFMEDGTDRIWFEDVVSLLKQYQLSSAWWAFYGPCGSYGQTIPSYLVDAWQP